MAELLKSRPKRSKPTGGLPPVLARGTERLHAAKAAPPAPRKAVKRKAARRKVAGKPKVKPAKRTTRSKTKPSRKATPARKGKAARKGGRRGR